MSGIGTETGAKPTLAAGHFKQVVLHRRLTFRLRVAVGFEGGFNGKFRAMASLRMKSNSMKATRFANYLKSLGIQA